MTSGIASMLLALSCSAPPGTEDEVPEFGGTSTPGTAPAVGAPGTQAPVTPVGNGSAPQSGAGAGGASGNEQTAANVPLQPGQGQNTGSGQNAGAGGSAMVNPQTGTDPGSSTPPGAGGSSMTAPVGTGGSSMGSGEPGPGVSQPPAPANPPPANPPPANPPPANPPPANPPPTVGCAGQFFCDDFEGVADGASPGAPLWTVIEGFAVRPASARVQVSGDNAHGGQRALRIDADSGRTGVQATLPQRRYFVRAWLQIDSAPRGPVFIGGGADQNSEVRLRIQGESFATINMIPGDAVRPAAANGGGCPDCVTLVPNEWFCAEMLVDDAARSATLWIDEVEAASVVNGDGGWPAQPANPALFLGSWGLQGGLTGVWIDDVVAGPNRIGCD